LGLGYLIHKFQEQKTFKKFFKIAVLILVTFTFDAILAYEITEKIYNIKKENTFQTMPDFSVQLAIHSVNFWLIIFAGFIVYLIWGFVFDFVIEAHGKMDKVKVAIREKDKQIKDAENEIKDLESQIEKMNHTIDDNITQINKLNKVLESTIVPREFEQDIYHFFDGWHEWMTGNQMGSAILLEAETTVKTFVQKTIYNLETINPN
jgi:DNA integrity scanning protein DisA with diadenylate cyclase activity